MSEILRTSSSGLVLAASSEFAKVLKLQSTCNATEKYAEIEVGKITVLNRCPAVLWDLPIKVENWTIADEQPGIVFFSSGSSGMPKGVIHSRAIFHGIQAVKDEAILIYRPASWIAGSKPVIQCILSGARAEIISPEADPKLIWERLRATQLTVVASSIMLWQRLARYYQEVLAHLPDRDREEYVQSARAIRIPIIGGGVPPSSLLKFWKEELQVPLVTQYGCTEVGVSLTSTHAGDAYVEV